MGSSAVALRYAEALYEAAKDQGRTEEVLADLAGLKVALQSNPKALAKLFDPKMDLTQRLALVDGELSAGRDPLVLNLLKLLLTRRREDALHDIFRHYLEVHEEREGILRVEVETATPLEEGVAAALESRLAATTGKPVVIETHVVPELLGGMRLKTGSRLIDGSIRRQLERIEKGLRSAEVGATTV